MAIKYYHTNHINGEPGGLIRFAIEGWIEICDRGWSWDDWLPFQPEDSAVYCMNGPNIIGTLVYSYDQTNRKIVVELAYINPEYRHLKLYDELYRFLYENIEPLNYVEMISAMKASYFILTDSGGLQEEAPALGKPVLILRNTTERPEGIQAGTSYLVGTEKENINKFIVELIKDKTFYKKISEATNPFGDGNASLRILDIVSDFLKKTI